MLCLFFLLVSNSLIASPAAIEVLSASGLTHSIAQARTMYADIGDSEDDPFLQKMINLGFNSGHKH